MTNVGFATLSIIPSMQGFQSRLTSGTSGPLGSAGSTGGRKFGEAAAKSGADTFKSKWSDRLKGFAPFAGIALGAGITSMFADVLGEAREAAQVSNLTSQLVETTGKAAGLTADQIGALATKMSDYAAVDDEVVQAGENVLLTFKNVRDAVGEGNDVFSRATKDGLDLAAVMGTDLKGAALQLGKALNDPIKGITALSRAGVSFSEQQKVQIKNYVASGNLLAAQKLILGELEAEVGGAAGAAADGTARFSVAIGNLKEAVGTELLPAVNKFTNWAAADAIPALSNVAGAVGDAVRGFAGLPGPVKAGTAAFVALRLAAGTALATSVASAVAAVGSSFVGLRIRLMLAADAYASVRAGAAIVTATNGGVIASNSRVAASFAALRTVATGAGTAIRRGLSGALGLIGGPWGAALIAGTVLLTKWWQAHQEAKQHIDDLSHSLDQQSGAITKNTRELVASKLQQDGILDTAAKLGLSLSDVTRAAVGNSDAMSRLQTAYAAAKVAAQAAAASGADNTHELQGRVFAIGDLIGALGGEAEAVSKSRDRTRQLAEALRDTAGATSAAAAVQKGVTDTMSRYRDKVTAARDAVTELYQAENRRRLAAVQAKRDEIALIQTYQAAAQEARKGARTLDENTKAGQDNLTALLDLADQWNNSKNSVTNARGAYEDMRKKFVEVAQQMGATKTEARNMAREFLRVPKRLETTVTTPGMDKALADLQRIKDLAHNYEVSVGAHSSLGGHSVLSSNYYGGWTGNVGRRTVAGVVHGQEYVQPASVVDYYGRGFMEALRQKKVPKVKGYQAGGYVAPVMAQAATSGGGGVVVNIGTVVAHDYDDFMRQMQRRSRASAGGGVRF